MPLKESKAEDGLRIAIHLDMNALSIFLLFTQMFGILVACAVATSEKPILGIFGFLVLGLLWLKFWFHRDVVTVTHSSFAVAVTILGMEFSSSTYENGDVENLGFITWPGGRAGEQRAISFEYHGLTVQFARQASSEDSWELIDEMRTLYPFPGPTS